MSPLRELLEQPDLRWLVDKLCARLRRGQPLPAQVRLSSPNLSQRECVNRLFGRRPRGRVLTVDVGELERILVRAGHCESLAAALEECFGPLSRAYLERQTQKQLYEELFEQFIGRETRPHVRAWLVDLAQKGLLQRLSVDFIQGRALLQQALRVADQLPADGVALAELAAEVSGDAHALDRGRPLGTLCLRLADHLGGARGMSRRDLWTSAGVQVDEVSSSVLVLNLRASEPAFLADYLAAHAALGEPCRLTGRHLTRHKPSFACQPVYVCENPTVLAAVADKLGPRSRPLICCEGFASNAAERLLRLLSQQEVPLLYHGDFDWKGLAILNTLRKRHPIHPWRMGAADYRALDGGTVLEGEPVQADWDAKLAPAMLERGLAFHEEMLLATLVEDLTED